MGNGTGWPEVRVDQLAQVRVMPFHRVPVNGARRERVGEWAKDRRIQARNWFTRL
jgi:hypothetical protein